LIGVGWFKWRPKRASPLVSRTRLRYTGSEIDGNFDEEAADSGIFGRTAGML
jgi:hypothetical protein